MIRTQGMNTTSEITTSLMKVTHMEIDDQSKIISSGTDDKTGTVIPTGTFNVS